MTKTEKHVESNPVPAPRITTSKSTSIPLIAMVLGVVSFTTFTWFLGIPAIVLGLIGLKKYPENRGYSITGLVTGIISTLLMIGFTIFLIALITIGIIDETNNNTDPRYDDRYQQQEEEYQDRYYRYDREGV